MKIKKRFALKLSHKLTIGFVLLGIIICSTSCTIGYIKYKTVIEKLYNDTAYQIADVALSYINGDDIERYLLTGETDESYETMGAQISRLRTSMKANYIYIAKLEGVDLTYIYDADNQEDAYPPYVLGDTGQINPEFEEDAKIIINTGERVDNYFYSHSQFGYNTSAIVPIYNSKNEIVAILGTEIAMKKLQDTLFEYVLYAVIISTALTALFIACYLMYLHRRVVAPIKLITAEADNFIKRETKISEKLDKVKTNDEIELLATSIKKMEIDIKDYIENLTKVTTEKERIGAELNVATQIQASMLPCIFPAFPEKDEFDIYATMQPAKEVGGDFYDFFLIDNNHLAVVIADVSGKGVPAALFMVIAKTLIKNQVQAGHTPAEVFTMVNAQLCENNEAGMFVTAWMGVYEITTGEFTYVNAGHNPPLIKKGDSKYEYLKSRPGFVLGGMEDIRYTQYDIQLAAGDELYLYTDGVTEATDALNELYGDERLQNLVNDNIDVTPSELLTAVRKDIEAFVKEAPQFDDITMLALKIK